MLLLIPNMLMMIAMIMASPTMLAAAIEMDGNGARVIRCTGANPPDEDSRASGIDSDAGSSDKELLLARVPMLLLIATMLAMIAMMMASLAAMEMDGNGACVICGTGANHPDEDSHVSGADAFADSEHAHDDCDDHEESGNARSSDGNAWMMSLAPVLYAYRTRYVIILFEGDTWARRWLRKR